MRIVLLGLFLVLNGCAHKIIAKQCSRVENQPDLFVCDKM